jgi:hypothetical protein
LSDTPHYTIPGVNRLYRPSILGDGDGKPRFPVSARPEKDRFSNRQKRSTFALSGLENPFEKFFTFVGYVRVWTTDQDLDFSRTRSGSQG